MEIATTTVRGTPVSVQTYCDALKPVLPVKNAEACIASQEQHFQPLL